jgi:phosphoglycolate phosphatase
MSREPVSPTDLLLLFDIDGTLVRGATEAHRKAIHHALHEVHGIADVERERVRGIDPAGRTDGEIARLILLAHEVSAERIDARHVQVRLVASETYARICPPDLSHTVLPGVPELLQELAERDGVHVGLLTGNYQAIAWVKLRAARIAPWFESGEGAYGSDSEARTDLPEIARIRAGRRGDPHPPERTVVIGDTPRDIACARSDGDRCLAVATGPHGADELGGADGIAADALSLLPLIDALV